MHHTDPHVCTHTEPTHVHSHGLKHMHSHGLTQVCTYMDSHCTYMDLHRHALMDSHVLTRTHTYVVT